MPTRLPPELAGQPFHVATALRHGITRDRLRARDLVAPFHGVRAREAPTTVLARCAAYLPRMMQGQAFSHATAAAIHGIPVPTRLERDERLHVIASAPAHPPQARGVVGHRSSRPIVVVARRGLPVVEPTLAWCQLSPILTHEDLVVAGDALVRRKRPLASIDELRDAVNRHSGRGIRALRRALNDVRGGTDSPMETRLRLMLMASGLPEPVVGHTVRFENGDFVGTPDLAYVPERVAIEYEGVHHRTDARTYADDIARRDVFAQAGWRVVLVIRDHFAAPLLIVRRVRRALDERGEAVAPR